MKAVFQRVTDASVTVDGKTVGAIGAGALVLVGIVPQDTEKEAQLLAQKVAGLRVFTDTQDKMNLSVTDIGGSVLAVSQFTLCADISHGRRPSFIGAAAPDVASPLFDHFCDALRALGVPVETGVFGAHMQVSLLNNGPVTILLDTDIWKKDGAACR